MRKSLKRLIGRTITDVRPIGPKENRSLKWTGLNGSKFNDTVALDLDNGWIIVAVSNSYNAKGKVVRLRYDAGGYHAVAGDVMVFTPELEGGHDNRKF